jgi:predicted RNase H-like HicB family nuclease
MNQTLTAILHQEGKLFVAECSETGTASQGETVEKAIANLTEATALYLEEFPQHTSSHPILTTFEVPVHA